MILSTSPWSNPSALPGKLAWIKRHFGDGPDNPFYKKVVFSHRKDLAVGDYLVDDRPTMRGADRFRGELIHFGGAEFPDWGAVVGELQIAAHYFKSDALAVIALVAAELEISTS